MVTGENKNKFFIRRYRETDRKEVVRIWLNESLRAHSFIPADFWLRHIVAMQEKYLPEAETYVADCEGEIAGFICLIGNYVGALFVDYNYHRKGIGRELMKFVHGKKGNLYVDVYKENKDAQKFYQAYGFTVRRERIQPETGHSVLTMYI